MKVNEMEFYSLYASARCWSGQCTCRQFWGLIHCNNPEHMGLHLPHKCDIPPSVYHTCSESSACK